MIEIDQGLNSEIGPGVLCCIFDLTLWAYVFGILNPIVGSEI